MSQLDQSIPGQDPAPDRGGPAATVRHARLIRALQYLGAAIVFGTLAAVAAWLGHNFWQREVATRARHSNRNAIVRVLLTAGGPDLLDQAVDPDGVVLRLRDGSWIAIKYVEGNHLPRAVARDSGGSWFESDRQFGTLLAHYKLWQAPRARAKASNDPEWSENGFLSLGLNRQLDAIEQAATLGQARKAMQELGFEEFKP